MRDAVELETKGKPTVTIAEDAFVGPARVVARSLGFPDLPMVTVPRAQNSGEDLRQAADNIFLALVRALTGAKG